MIQYLCSLLRLRNDGPNTSINSRHINCWDKPSSILVCMEGCKEKEVSNGRRNCGKCYLYISESFV